MLLQLLYQSGSNIQVLAHPYFVVLILPDRLMSALLINMKIEIGQGEENLADAQTN